MAQVWRLIKHGPGEPAWNMAVDEALVTLYTRSGSSTPVLRLYTWDSPALSLGYFQKEAQIGRDLLDALDIVPVKRITGGRAVLHYGDLTYSLVATAGRDTPEGVAASYRYLCEGLLAAFASLGITAQLGTDKARVPWSASCFAVATPGDITWQGRKFVGSAQKRFGSSLLQHGSILIRSQEEILARVFAGEGKEKCQALLEKTTCLETIMGHRVEVEQVARALVDGYRKALNIEFRTDDLSKEERALAEALVDKYRP